MLVIWSLLRYFTRWLLARPGRDSRHRHRGRALPRWLPRHPCGAGHPARLAAPGLSGEPARLEGKGLSDELAGQLAALPYLAPCCDIIEIARERKLKAVDVARVYFRLGDALNLPWLTTQIDALNVDGRWHAVARGVLRDELRITSASSSIRCCRCPARTPMPRSRPGLNATTSRCASPCPCSQRTGGAEDPRLPDRLGRRAASLATRFSRLNRAQSPSCREGDGCAPGYRGASQSACRRRGDISPRPEVPPCFARSRAGWAEHSEAYHRFRAARDGLRCALRILLVLLLSGLPPGSS